MELKWYLGAFSFCLSLSSIFLNLLIFFPVFRLAFIAKKSTVYIIAFFNIISDLCQLFVACFYLSTSIMADRYVFTGARDNWMSVFLGGFFLNAWYMECLVQIVMAVNRFTIITLKQYNVFTFRITCLIFVALISCTSFTAFAIQYLLPCCIFICDHKVLSFMFIPIEGVYNYSNFILVSYDVFCTTSSTICYIFVFITIRNASKVVDSTNMSKDRSKQDVKYLLQFVFISIFYIFTWVLFEILPHVVPTGQVEWFAIVPVLVTLNCSSNTVIYLCVNREVQKSLSIVWLRDSLSRSSKVSAAAPSTTGRTAPTN